MEEVVVVFQGPVVVTLPAVTAQARNAPHEGGDTGGVADLSQVAQRFHPQGLHGPEDGPLALPREGPTVDGVQLQ